MKLVPQDHVKGQFLMEAPVLQSPVRAQLLTVGSPRSTGSFMVPFPAPAGMWQQINVGARSANAPTRKPFRMVEPQLDAWHVRVRKIARNLEGRHSHEITMEDAHRWIAHHKLRSPWIVLPRNTLSTQAPKPCLNCSYLV